MGKRYKIKLVPLFMACVCCFNYWSLGLPDLQVIVSSQNKINKIIKCNKVAVFTKEYVKWFSHRTVHAVVNLLF